MSDPSESDHTIKSKRKEKSLCEITRRFLSIVLDKENLEMHLDYLITLL